MNLIHTINVYSLTVFFVVLLSMKIIFNRLHVFISGFENKV